MSGFSHARRVIFAPGGPESRFPRDDPSVARWDGEDCVSQRALSSSGAGG